MIEEFVDSVTIIDNTVSEVEGLQKALNSKKILYDYYHPDAFVKKRFKLKNRKLIFLDLYLNSTLATATGQISAIRNHFKQIIGKDFGVYGIVLWTKHLEEIDQFKEKIANNRDEYTLPLFVVGLDKTKYLAGDFKEIFKDINQILIENTASSFFIKWSNAIERAKNKTIIDIFSLVKDYKLQDDNLKYLLYHLAKNKTGIYAGDIVDYPLYEDAFRAFSELLIYDISSKMTSEKCLLFNSLEELSYRKEHLSKDYKDRYYKDEEEVNIKSLEQEKDIIKNKIKILNSECNCPAKDEKIRELKSRQTTISTELTTFKGLDKEIKSHFSSLNTKMLLDENVKLLKKVLPGNIYVINDEKSIFISDKKNPSDIPIVIEMTPPCDFANGKKAKQKVKMLGGFITKYSAGRKESLNSEAIYTEPHPLKLKEGPNEDKMIVFDLRYFGVLDEKNLLNKKKYELIYRAKDNLFADILQKMSAHISRLGLAVLH